LFLQRLLSLTGGNLYCSVAQAVTLQAALSEAQEASLMLQGQVASQQHNMNLLGGNLQGRLSLVQGSVLAQMQEQVNHKDAALAASAQHVLAIQAELERLSCSYAAKLAAEQLERQRLAAEAAQARLLCTARGRQVASLQQELQQLRDAASQQQQTAAVSTSVQQQQLESLRERLQVAQQQLEAAQFEAEEAQQVAAAAEGGRSCLRQQVEELQALLTEKQLQIEWLEGKVADLEGSDMSQQVGAPGHECGLALTTAILYWGCVYLMIVRKYGRQLPKTAVASVLNGVWALC
jgi:chromosome segregation ATPase